MAPQRVTWLRTAHHHRLTLDVELPFAATLLQLVDLSLAQLGSLPKEAPANVVVPDDKAVFRGADIRTRDDSMPLAHVALAVEGAEWTSPYAFPLMIMQTMLGSWDRTVGAGGNMSSRLCQNVGQKDLAHSLTSFNTCYKDTGLFGVYAVAEPHKLNDLMYHTLHCMVRGLPCSGAVAWFSWWCWWGLG